MSDPVTLNKGYPLVRKEESAREVSWPKLVSLAEMVDSDIHDLEQGMIPVAAKEISDADSPYMADFGDIVFVDLENDVVEVTFPAADITKAAITIVDFKGLSATNNIILTPNGGETIDGETSIEMDINKLALTLVPLAGGWGTR